MEYINLLQWPAMIVTVVASWLVGSLGKHRRTIGFWLFLISNVLWVLWGIHDDAYALIALQIALAAMNIRGVFKNEKVASNENSSTKHEAET